jgi:hypothetical protein
VAIGPPLTVGRPELRTIAAAVADGLDAVAELRSAARPA